MIQEVRAVLHNQIPAARLSNVSGFLAWLPLRRLPRRLALFRKHSSPASRLLSIPLVWCLLALEFLQDSYPETLPPTLTIFAIATTSLMISLIASVVSPVKSRTTSGHSFLQQEFIVLGVMTFTAFQ